jgi:hypothetical protein
MKTHLDLYRTARREFLRRPELYCQTGLAARQLAYAKRAVRVATAWEAAEEMGMVRLRLEADDCVFEDGLFGDCFNPAAHPDIKPEVLEEQHQHEVDRVNRDGVWVLVSEYKDDDWRQAFSCGGIIGDDWRGDVELDAKEAALAGLDR